MGAGSLKVRALVEVYALQRQPMGLAIQYGVERLLRVHAKLAVALPRLPVDVGVHSYARTAREARWRRLLACPKSLASRQLAKTVCDDHASMLNGSFEIVRALIDAVHQQLLARHAGCHRDCDFAHAGAIYPQTTLLCPARDRSIQ